jgi:outer membrane protein assembly factor BamB
MRRPTSDEMLMFNRFKWGIGLLLCAVPACTPEVGDDLWRLQTPRPFLAGNSEAFAPAVGAGTVFFCGGYAYDAASELVAVNTTDGVPRWRVSVQSCGGSPAVLDSMVVAFAREAHSPRFVLFGIDAATGGERWRKAVGEIVAHATIGRSVLLARGDGSLQRVDATTGELNALELSPEPADRPWMSTADGHVIIGAGQSIWDISGDRSDPVPGRRLQSHITDVIAGAAENNLLVLQDRKNGLAAFERSSGRLLWTNHWTRLLGGPAISHGRVFINTFGPNRYELQAIDGESGRALWQVPDGGFEPPVEGHGKLYAAGRSSVLVIDPQTGSVLESIPTSTEIISSPVPLDRYVLFGTIDGVLHAGSERGPDRRQ